jgi:hypothetical protein
MRHRLLQWITFFAACFLSTTASQGCQMVYFKTKNLTLGIFRRALEGICWYMYILYGRLGSWFNICMAVWYSLWSFGILFPFWHVWTRKKLVTLLQVSGIDQGCQMVYLLTKNSIFWSAMKWKVFYGPLILCGMFDSNLV